MTDKTITIEVPFPNDCAQFKVVVTNPETGKGKIVAAAQTVEAARLLAIVCFCSNLAHEFPHLRSVADTVTKLALGEPQNAEG